ncbi:trypsin delta-like [Leguminivora glycinivorella]|uniref:trypsin delta-like n=1 Tax=Leguminivora glycinivorella TaxID=1035111 RepID=UPI00200D25A9|nr:trypsin delta-like [Leguminivora glycinivorella]
MRAKKKLVILFSNILFQLINARKRSEMTGFIVDGFLSDIESFPFAVYISKSCNLYRNSSCGASILNQVILLTAAHCFKNCDPFTVNAYAGSIRKHQGFKNKVLSFKKHEHYNQVSHMNDIALLRLETELVFGRAVKRIILMKHPPNNTKAVVAGWGWIDSKGTRGDVLKHAPQLVLDREQCASRLGNTEVPEGMICGEDTDNVGYPEKGDSGGPLVVNKNIQIGIVSFKRRRYTNSTIAYTYVPYFYDWIVKNARKLYCKYESETLDMQGFSTDVSHCDLATRRGYLKFR